MRIESRDFKTLPMNSRKAECGAKQFLTRLAVRAAPLALLFDLDGTLYKQSMIRRRMAGRLLKSCLAEPIHGWRILRGLRAYRRAQEEMRGAPPGEGGLENEQLLRASRSTGLRVDELRQMVALWMEERPLDLLAGAVWEGLEAVLAEARRRGLRLGVVSDYPAEKKLEAMRLRRYFDTVVTAQDTEVQRFKPDERGINVALERLHARPGDALFIGDRPDVDAEAARRAGVACAILDPKGANRKGEWLAFTSYPELGAMLLKPGA
jgi:HAD superfamily hydrolase (TIGR01509 family)